MDLDWLLQTWEPHDVVIVAAGQCIARNWGVKRELTCHDIITMDVRLWKDILMQHLWS